MTTRKNEGKNFAAQNLKSSSEREREIYINPWWDKALVRVLGRPLRLLIAGLFFLFLSFLFPHYEVAHPVSGDGATKTILDYIWLLPFFNLYFWHEFFRDLGIAFIVAVGIALAIERVADQRRRTDIDGEVRKVQQSALAAVFNSSMPDGWLRFIRDTLHERKFYRFVTRVRYDISEPPEEYKKKCPHIDFVVTQITIYCKVKNVGSSNDTYKIEPFIEYPWERELRSIPHLDYIMENKVLWSHEVMQEVVNSKEEMPYGAKYYHEVPLNAGEEKEIEIRIQQINYARDTTTYTCLEPSDSIDVQVKAPSSYLTYAALKHSSTKGHGTAGVGQPISSADLNAGMLNSELSDDKSEDQTKTKSATEKSKFPKRKSSSPTNEAAAQTAVVFNHTDRRTNEMRVGTVEPCFPGTSVEISWTDNRKCQSDKEI